MIPSPPLTMLLAPSERAFWSGDGSRLLAVLDEGLASPEFLEFKRGLGLP